MANEADWYDDEDWNPSDLFFTGAGGLMVVASILELSIPFGIVWGLPFIGMGIVTKIVEGFVDIFLDEDPILPEFPVCLQV